MNLHNYKRQYERQVELAQGDSRISKENKKWISKFASYMLSDGISHGKVGRYILDLRKLAIMLPKPFQNANKDDIRKVVGEIEQTNLSAESKKTFKIMLRKLYRLIRDIDEKGVYPLEVKWISIAIPKNHTKLPEELLTDKEIEEMIRNCMCVRDRALIALLAESGCRISEIGLMKIKSISFEEVGARITVSGKTGMRKILVINSLPYLQEWINQHPKNNDSEAYLWYNPQGEFLGYNRLSAILRSAGKKAGIKKRIYPHLFRHSRATRLASIMSEASMKHYLGWAQSSKMCGIYIHMNGKETDDAILRANGVETNKEKPKPMIEPKKCLRCNTVNEVTNRFCKLCGLSLNQEEANNVLKDSLKREQADEVMDNLLSDPEILELIKQKLRDFGSTR
jgi:integrase/recombinase XerD